MTTQTIDTAERALIEQRAAAIVAIVDETIGLEEFEQDHLADNIASPGFYEFWSMGKKYSSYKVYNRDGIPFIVDQHRRKDMVKPIIAANEQIKALFI